MKRIIALFLSLMLLAALAAGCTPTESSGSDSGKSKYASAYDQLKLPAQGDEIAVMHTSMGDIFLRFFPEAAPKAVENFKTHAKNGYYNGLIFHRVINNFMIQGGDPLGTGMGGDSIWGTDFADEFDPNLMNIRGALSMANSGANTNGSQFFIVQVPKSEFYGWDYYAKPDTITNFKSQGIADYNIDSWNAEQRKVYEENGGTPHLDGAHRNDGKGHTVFGQVFKGLEIVDAIAKVQVDGGSKPLENVTITSIEIKAYEG